MSRVLGLDYNFDFHRLIQTTTFECDWLTELSDNKVSNGKLPDSNLASELVENSSFFQPITIQGIVISMMKIIIITTILVSIN